MITCTKTYADLPFAHRQHMHAGHCALIHGHNWSITFTFTAAVLDECGFVVDFGKLKWLKSWLNERFDHTLVLNANDPKLDYLGSCLTTGQPGYPVFAKIIVVPDCSCEGLAGWLFTEVSSLLRCREDLGARGVRLLRVVVQEDSKNSATAGLDA